MRALPWTNPAFPYDNCSLPEGKMWRSSRAIYYCPHHWQQCLLLLTIIEKGPIERGREKEVGMLFPPIRQSSIYIWWKTKHTGRFSLLCLVRILDYIILKSKMEIRGNIVKWAHSRGDEGFGGTWMILKFYFCHMSLILESETRPGRVSKIYLSKAFMKQTNTFCFGEG